MNKTIAELYASNPIIFLSNDGLIPVDQSPITSSSSGAIKKSDLFTGLSTDVLGLHKSGAETVTGAKTFNAGTFLDKGSEVYNVKAGGFNAVGDGVTNDATAINAAITAANAAGGGVVFVPKSSSSYIVNSDILLLSNVSLISNGATITTTRSSQELIAVVNRSKVRISGFILNAPSGVAHFKTVGHDDLEISDNDFIGVSGTAGNIVFDSAAASNFDNTDILRNTFTDITGTAKNISVGNSSHTVSNLNIYGNRFTRCTGAAINLIAGNLVTDVYIERNTDIDRVGAHGATRALLVTGGDNRAYQLSNVFVLNNYFKTTVISTDTDGSTGHSEMTIGFCDLYAAKNIKVLNNTAIGTFTAATRTNPATSGIFFATGRVQWPNIGVEVSGNYVEQYGGFIDFDSTINGDIHHNILFKVGTPVASGFGIQKNLKIHDNISVYPCKVADGNGNLVADQSFTTIEGSSGNFVQINNNLSDNVYFDDRPIVPPVGVTATVSAGGTLTAATTYYYVVTALDEGGETIASSQVSGLTTSSNKTITIQWFPVLAATSYRIYRSTTSGVYGATSLVGTGDTHFETYQKTDTGITLTTGTPPLVSTVFVPEFDSAIAMFNADLTSWTVRNNTFYYPQGTFSAGYIKNNGPGILPKIIDNNRAVDTTGDILFNKSKVPTIAKTANYTVTAIDSILTGDCTSGNLTFTLPPVATSKDYEYTFKRIDGSGNNVIVDGNSTETIDGATTKTITTQWGFIKIACDGAKWIITASGGTIT